MGRNLGQRQGVLATTVVGFRYAPPVRIPVHPQERDLIRLELRPRFGQDPDLANGLFLRTWRDGP
jgi:hypothetical protein